MFERFFRPKTEEQIEKLLYSVATKELWIGINAPPMFHAFNAMREGNLKNNYGFYWWWVVGYC